jgi:hypothetical protein
LAEEGDGAEGGCNKDLDGPGGAVLLAVCFVFEKSFLVVVEEG